MGSGSWRQEREGTLGGNTQRQISLGESIFFLEEEEEEEDLKRRNGFHLSSSLIFFIFFIFFGCFSILHKLIPFSRVLDVV